jgi:hypothetical protein
LPSCSDAEIARAIVLLQELADILTIEFTGARRRRR